MALADKDRLIIELGQANVTDQSYIAHDWAVVALVFRLDDCTNMAGHGYIDMLVIGSPSYYSKSNFQALGRYSVTLPFVTSNETCMILPLTPHGLEGVARVVKHVPGWLEY